MGKEEVSCTYAYESLWQANPVMSIQLATINSHPFQIGCNINNLNIHVPSLFNLLEVDIIQHSAIAYEYPTITCDGWMTWEVVACIEIDVGMHENQSIMDGDIILQKWPSTSLWFVQSKWVFLD